MDAQYKFLRILCKHSDGTNYVPYPTVQRRWKNCPPPDVLRKLSVPLYAESQFNPVLHTSEFLPNASAFTYVRQCRDSIRNMVVTIVTLILTALALGFQIFGLFR